MQSTKAQTWAAAAAAFAGSALFNFSTGLIVFMWDSQLLADRAKHLAQQGNLNVSEVFGGLVYPPLYPIAITPAYFTQNPETTFSLLLLIHALLVALQVWPLRWLLAEYAGVGEKGSAWLAVALALAPYTLPYGAMVLTEVLYFPVLLWMICFYLRWQRSGSPRDAVGAGVFLALMMLTRAAALTVAVGVAGAMIHALWRARLDRDELRRRALGMAALLGTMVAITAGWKGFEKAFVSYGAVGAYFDLDDIKRVFSSGKEFDHHMTWLSNAVFYYITAPLSIAGFFFYALLFRRARLLLSDPLAPMALLTMAVSAVVVVLVMPLEMGGRDLTWNKYLAPYVIFPVLVAARYRAWYRGGDAVLAATILSVAVLAFRPASLGCHFADALVLFSANLTRLPLPETLANLLYAGGVLLPAWLWRRGAVRAAAVFTGIMWVSALAGTVVYYRNSGDFNISRYEGLAKRVLAETRANPRAEVYFDPKMKTDFFGAGRILFYWPTILQSAPPLQVEERARRASGPVYYFTDKEIGFAAPEARERSTIHLFKLSSGGAPEKKGLSILLAADVWAQEDAKWDGKDYRVRWLQRDTTFTVYNPGAATNAQVRMRLAVAEKPRAMRLEANGTLLAEMQRIERIMWVNGSHNVTFEVPMKPGPNRFRLTTADPLDMLPGGRAVSALLIGDIEVVERRD